jgi:hypothetical protein
MDEALHDDGPAASATDQRAFELLRMVRLRVDNVSDEKRAELKALGSALSSIAGQSNSLTTTVLEKIETIQLGFERSLRNVWIGLAALAALLAVGLILRH